MNRLVSPRCDRLRAWYVARNGITETPGADGDPEILRIMQRFHPSQTDDSTRPWCAMAVSVGVEEALADTLPIRWDETEGATDGPTLARTWLTFGTPVRLMDARQGDIVIFDREAVVDDGEEHGHVGTFHSIYTNADKSLRGIRLLGGNQDNAIKVYGYTFDVTPTGREYRLGKWLGIRRP